MGDYYDPATDSILTKDLAAKAWLEGFRNTLRRLTSAGVHVWVIRDIPKADDDYRACLLTNLNCATPRKQALAYPAIEVEVAREFGALVKVLDFTDEICDPSRCPVIRDGVVVYQDSHHLTATYAATFAPQFAALLRALAKNPKPENTNPLGRIEAGMHIPSMFTPGQGSVK